MDDRRGNAMDAERYQEIKRVYLHAADLPDEARARYLAEACAGDDGLRAEVDALLNELERRTTPPIRTRSPAELLHALDERDSRALERIGNYEIEALVDQGGMGCVFRATQHAPRRTVALKVMRSSIRLTGGLERFLREAELLGRVEDPGVVRIHEAGVARTANGDLPFLSMEFVEGRSLADLLAAVSGSGAHGATPWRTILETVARLARSAHRAHEAGIVHRDIKPSNVILRPDGTPVLIDFGLAREAAAPAVLTSSEGLPPGTPAYMAPEQILRPPEEIDRRADVWALGVILYEWVCGRRPFDAPTAHDVWRQICRDPLPEPTSAVHPMGRDLRVILATVLERDPARRYQSAAELAEDLERLVRREPIRARPAGLALRMHRWILRNPLVAGALLALTLLAGFALHANQRLLSANERTRTAQRDIERERARALWGAAELAVNAGRWDQALERLDDAERAGHDHAIDLDLLRLLAHWGRHDTTRALATLRRIDDRDATPEQRATLTLYRGDLGHNRILTPDAGLEQVEQALATGLLSPANAAYAQALLAHDFATARTHLRASIDAHPDSVLPYEILAGILLLTGRVDELRELVGIYRARFPESPAIDLLACFLVHSELGEEKATELLERTLLEMPPEQLDAYRLVFRVLGKLARARAGMSSADAQSSQLQAFSAFAEFRKERSLSRSFHGAGIFLHMAPVVARYVNTFGEAFVPKTLTDALRRITPKRYGPHLPALLAIHRDPFVLFLEGMRYRDVDPERLVTLLLEAADARGLVEVRREALLVALGELKHAYHQAPEEERRSVFRRHVVPIVDRLVAVQDLTAVDCVHACTWIVYLDTEPAARKLFQHATHLHPHDPHLLAREAFLEYMTGGYGRAIAAADRALERDPRNAVALDLRAKSLAMLGTIGRGHAGLPPAVHDWWRAFAVHLAWLGLRGFR